MQQTTFEMEIERSVGGSRFVIGVDEVGRGPLAGPVVAVLGLAGLDRLLPVANLGGLAVGGAVALWLLIGGVVWLVFQRPLSRPVPGGIVLGLLLFAVSHAGALWAAVVGP